MTGFAIDTIVPVLAGRRRVVSRAAAGALDGLLAHRFLARARLDMRTRGPFLNGAAGLTITPLSRGSER
jgi:hypothetical protein